MIWAGRLGIMLLSVLLGALIYRWAGQLFQSAQAGLLALLLYTFDPNILAHSFLATTD
ncbi:MAG TPA: phospholipid carrier-dependent glycosyltransferase, partial [Chloroflexi bacterium]|nr:phospholipid carrier-dependent glycosyltransferase [Chloroflexota bacterium]